MNHQRKLNLFLHVLNSMYVFAPEIHQRSLLIIQPGALATDGIAAYAIKFLGLAQPETRKENKGNFKSGQLLFFLLHKAKDNFSTVGEIV